MQLSRMALFVVFAFSAVAYAAPVHLRCESLQNPLGIDALTPHLSWQSDDKETNWKQSAYQILVSSSAEQLSAGRADAWDSGKVSSGESVGIAYQGPQLESRKRYYWNVRVWDSTGKSAQSSDAAWWEMGLLNKEDWKAKWITWTNPDEEMDRDGIRWIWVTGQDAFSMAPKTSADFRAEVDIPEKPREAALFLLARGDWVAKVNGHVVGAKERWNSFDRQDIAQELVPGKNLIEVSVTVRPPEGFERDAGAKTKKAALTGVLKVTRADGSVRRARRRAP